MDEIHRAYPIIVLKVLIEQTVVYGVKFRYLKGL
jgi:hypothetical protein